MNFLLRPHLPLLLGDGCVFSASVSCRRLCPVFKGRWTAWPMAVVDLIKPPKATQSLKGAVLKGRGVLPPLNQAEYDPSPSWGVPSPNRTYHSIKNGASLGGPSPGSVLPRLPWGQESRALLQSSLQAGGGAEVPRRGPPLTTLLWGSHQMIRCAPSWISRVQERVPGPCHGSQPSCLNAGGF